MKKLLTFLLGIIVFGGVFAMQRANFSLLDISAKRILFTDTGHPTGEKVLDINSGGNIVVYGPLVDSGNSDIFVPRNNVSTNSGGGISDTLLMSQKATTDYVDNNTLFKQSDGYIEAKTLGGGFKICDSMGRTYTGSQNTCLGSMNWYLSGNGNLVNGYQNSTDGNYNTILGLLVKTIGNYNAIFGNENESNGNNNLIQGSFNQNKNGNRNLIIGQNNQTVGGPIQNSIIVGSNNHISGNTSNSMVLGSLGILQNNNSFLFNSSGLPVYSEKNNSFVVYTDGMAINKRSADTGINLDVNGSIQTNEALYIGSSRRLIIDSDNLSVQNLSGGSRVEKHSFTP